MAIKSNIKCPYCGCEYLPAEIFYPDDFLGTPLNIIKDENHEIIGFDGNNMNTEETYVCDVCGKTFKVDAVVTFKVEKVKDVFEEEDF